VTTLPKRLTGLPALVILALTACDTRSPEPTGLDLQQVSAPQLDITEGAGTTQFVLTATRWGKAQRQAVEAAGGTLAFEHAASGIGLARSSSPDFLASVTASHAFTSAAKDVVVQLVAPNRSVAAQATTPGDETYYPLQWNMQAIEAPAAWAGGATGAGARVAIVDGGIYDVHPDLAPNLDASCSTSFVPGKSWNEDVGTLWHGTHVAGIVAAADNSFGVIGVAPEATLMGVKVLDGVSGSLGAVIQGILFAADPAAFGFSGCRRADIINMSLGLGADRRDLKILVSVIGRAVNFAASRGVLVVSAAGNEGLDIAHIPNALAFPAGSGNGLAVSATGPVGFAYGGTDFRRVASYTDYGVGFIDIAGPGGDDTLYPADPYWYYDMVMSTCRGTSTPPYFSFCFVDGTSMATPAVAGVAALIVGQHPGISVGKLKRTLLNTADDEGKPGYDAYYGHGFVNAARATGN
jgi:subtilisin family serine protease